MFYVRSLPLLILCTCLSAFQSPENRLGSSDRKNLPQKAERITASMNYTNSSNNDRDAKKASNKLKRIKRFAHLTRLKRSVKLEEDEFENDDEEEENIIEEPYLHCKDNKCKNGGSCFQRGQEFWCVCGRTFAGKWCELKREPSIEGAGCDKSIQNRLAVALGAVILIFLIFVIILAYWCRRRVPGWKNEKEEWDQLLKDRLEDDYNRKMMAVPNLPPRPPLPPKSPQLESSNDSSPKYISLTDVRKYLDNSNGKEESRKSVKDTPSNRDSKLKLKKSLTMDGSSQHGDKPRKGHRSKSSATIDHNTPNLFGGYYPQNYNTQTGMTKSILDSSGRETSSMNTAVTSKKVQRASLEQHSPRSRCLSIESRSSSKKPRTSLEQHVSRCRPVSMDSVSSSEKFIRTEHIQLFSE